MEDIKGKYEGLCPSCMNSRYCEVWTEWKCIPKTRRYEFAGPRECEHFKKAPVKFDRPPCQCEDCLRRGKMEEEIV